MDSVKRLIMLQVPTSICNFRCHYCYLAQRDIAYQGEQAQMKYSPTQVAAALRVWAAPVLSMSALTARRF